MKKILFIVLIVLGMISFNKIKFHAEDYNMLKKLFIVSGSYDTLDYPGFKLMESDINYYKEGLYFATYKEDVTDRIFKREIEVVSSNVFLKSGIKNVNLKEEYCIKEGAIIKRVCTTGCNILVYEKEETVYLEFIYSNSTKEIEIFKRDVFTFVDMVYCKTNNKLYLIGNLYKDSLDVYLAEYSLNGDLEKETVFKGSDVDYVTNIHIVNDNIFLTGYTSSSDEDFSHTAYSSDSYILKVDLNTFEKIDYLDLGEEGIDYIESSCYVDGLYVIKHYYDSGLHLVRVYKFDNYLNEVNNIFLGTISYISDVAFKEYNNELYYFCRMYDEELNDDVSVLYKLTKNLIKKKLDTYYDKYALAKDLNIVNGEISLLYTSYSIDENYPTYIRIVTDKELKFTLDNRIYDYCYFNELGNLDLLYDNTLKCFEYSLVYANTLGSFTSDEDINPVVMCNNTKVCQDEYLSNTFFDNTMFGVYNLTYYYKFDFFDLVFRKDIVVSDEIKIDSSNIYTKGLILTFRGKGYLNNRLIESGYIIDEIGEYELKVIGYLDKTLIYDFKVVENNSFKEEQEINNYELSVTVNQQEQLDNIKINSHNIINEIVEDNYENKIWYIIIPICTLVVTVSTFMFIGRKIR